jgi:hypothetical protein
MAMILLNGENGAEGVPNRGKGLGFADLGKIAPARNGPAYALTSLSSGSPED